MATLKKIRRFEDYLIQDPSLKTFSSLPWTFIARRGELSSLKENLHLPLQGLLQLRQSVHKSL